jgi:hypothetical protein
MRPGGGRVATLARQSMARTRDIRTNQTDVSCDVCGRTLLRGERAEPYLAGGARRQVCELCTTRAQHEGWIRENGADELQLRSARHERPRTSWIERLRARRERARDVAEQQTIEPPEVPEPRRTVRRLDTPSPESPPTTPPPEPAQPRQPRHVRAVPTNADLKMQRALELFNASDHTRTVGGVARSLGPPAVSVRPLAERPSVVTITVMWELSWYRFEVDLSDEAGGVRKDGQGSELSELAEDEHAANAAADERGGLHLATAAT